MMDQILSKDIVKRLAAECGFDACGVAKAELLPLFAKQLREWVGEGYHGEMGYMAEHMEMRADPTLLVPGAQSVISLLLAYKTDRTVPGIAMYAQGEDYHARIKRMLYLLISKIKEHCPAFEAKPCVDTVPISDKLWAWKAGLGWIGKNSLLIHPTYGSFCFLAELVTHTEIDHYDQPMENRCGTCEACLRACPNQAINLNSLHSTLNSPRCTSYNTIENRASDLPEGLNRKGYRFGCDLCQLACPYNRQAPFKEADSGGLDALLEVDDEADFKRLTRHTALSRIKYAQWQRNGAHLND